jgi:hypothetical protein
MATYSFGDVSATLNGPSGSFQLAAGAGAAEEGLSIAAVADTDTMTVGAGGYAMHSLSLDTSATVTVRLLKTSPVNAQLMNAYTAQRRSSLLHGNNAITVRDVNRGDLVICRQVAFAKVPDLNYGKEGGMNEWVFNAGQTDYVLGVGTPEI